MKVEMNPTTTAEDVPALAKWLPVAEEPGRNLITDAAYWRNVQRAASAYGPKMVALLINAGAIEPEQDPMEALAGLLSLKKSGEEALKIVQAINTLREYEGDAVTIMSDNPDFNEQPNCAVECNGSWTEYEYRRFTGDTLLKALEAAVEAYQNGG